MNIKSIIASLVLAGSSSAAMASPVTFSGSVQAGVSINTGYTQPVIRDHRDRDWVRDHRTNNRVTMTYVQPTYVQPAPEPIDSCNNISIDGGVTFYRGWVGAMPPSGHASIALTAPTKIMGGREIFEVGARSGVISALTLQGNGGSTFIQGVQLTLGKGDIQWVPVNAWLSGNQSFAFDVDHRRGRAITEITVFGSSNPGARYSITAQR
jgi:hypothetical protein